MFVYCSQPVIHIASAHCTYGTEEEEEEEEEEEVFHSVAATAIAVTSFVFS